MRTLHGHIVSTLGGNFVVKYASNSLDLSSVAAITRFQRCFCSQKHCYYIKLNACGRAWVFMYLRRRQTSAYSMVIIQSLRSAIRRTYNMFIAP